MMEILSVLLTTVSFGFLLPTSISLTITKSKWARPVQALGAVLGLLGIWICGGNSLLSHRIVNIVLSLLVVVQALGEWFCPKSLDVRLARWPQQSINLAVKGVKTSILALGWIQITSCSFDTLGIVEWPRIMLAHTCPAFFIIILAVFWLSSATGARCLRHNTSPEYYDSVFYTVMSAVLMPIVILSDFLWKDPKNGVLDVPVHSFLLFMMLVASQLGIWLSKDAHNRPSRNLLPCLIAYLFGQFMIAHHQDTHLGKMVHECFGYSLVAMGGSRALEILIIPRPIPTFDGDAVETSDYDHLRYLPPMFAVMSAFMILAGADDLVVTFNKLAIRPPGYVATVQALAFGYFWFLCVLVRRIAAQASYVDSHGHTKEYEYDQLPPERAEAQPLAP